MNIKNASFLFAENPNPMWIYDPIDLSIKEVNEAACNLYGYSRKEFLGLTIADLRPKSEYSKLKKVLSKQVDKYNDAGVWKHRKKNGELLFVHVLSYKISEDEKIYKLVSVQDVTENIIYRQELQMLMENSIDGIMLTNPDGRIYQANKAACRILGMSEEQIVKLGREGLVLKDHKLRKALEERKLTGEFTGELTFIHSSGRKIPVELSSKVYQTPEGEARTSMIFRDITERKETVQKLQDVITYSSNLFYQHDINHILTYVSPQSERFLGYSPEEATHKWTDFITDHPINNKGLEFTEKAINTGEVQLPYELELRKKNGELIWVHVNEAPIIEDGKTVAIVGSLTDITQQKNYEGQLKESLDRYYYATKATKDIIYDWDIENDQLHFGDGFDEVFGYTPGYNSLPLKEFTQYVHPEDHPAVMQSLEHALGNPVQNRWSNEYRFKNSDGMYANVTENGYILRDSEGVAIRMIGAIRDVTNQQKLERLLEQAYKMGRIGIWELNLNNNDLYWSRITKELHEVGPDFYADLNTAINFYKEGESRKTIRGAIERAINEGIPWDEELQIVTSKGNTRWVRVKGEPEMIDGHCQRIFGIFQDIHERREAQFKMEQAYEERKRILERITEAFFAVDKNWIVTYWNSQAEEIIGMSRTEVIGKNLWETFPEAKKLSFFDHLEKAFLQQIPFYFEEFYPPLKVWLEVHGNPSEDGLSVFFRDVTDRKRDQIELEKAFREKENILESIGDGFFTVNKNWTVTYWNHTAERLLETPKDSILHHNLWEVFYDAKDLPSYRNYHKVMHERVSIDFEDYYRPLDRWYDISAYPSDDGISVYFRDITESKIASLKVADSEERLRLATEQADIAVWEYDFNTNSMSRSNNHDKLYGLDLQDHWEINTFLNATHPEDREYSHSFIKNSVAPGGPDDYDFDFRVIYPDGSIHWLYVTGRVIERDENGEGITVRGTLSDITEQKNREELLIDSLNEKKTLLAEIHHRVKNNLAVVSGILQLQAFEENDEGLQQKLNESISRIRTIGSIHELLYQSSSFSKLSIDQNIKKLVSEIAETFQPAVVLDIVFDLMKTDLNINQAIPLSLIVNEVVTNVYKHAFDESQNGKLIIALSEKNDTISLKITDNGKGLPADFKNNKPLNSLGIQLIETLTRQLGSDFSYETENGETYFNLTFIKKEIRGSASALVA